MLHPADPKARMGEFIERTYDYVIASHSLQGKIKNMDAFEPRPRKAVTFLAERDFQVCREHKNAESRD